ncbi:MAG: 3-methyl-2-oxobutanoate hydroxymethyltransferase [Herpetosiphonaceae bacterium]|nr:3-methyl-2-oxobutanoate hydroxymethyltransferase [Herpetosiphonaceae bacterium]
MRTTIQDLAAMKRRGERIPMLTAYDYTTARLVEAAGVRLILVGDSGGQWMLGHPTTVQVTLDEMVLLTRSVVRGTSEALVVGDLPFMSYGTPEQALTSAARLMQEGGCQAVKLEGGRAVAETVRRLTDFGAPVMGHLGYTPQSVNVLGNARAQGKAAGTARRLLDDALALEAAGAFAVVLELVPTDLAHAISTRLHVPTIGIGAGPGCDGQVQVLHDMLGLLEDFIPRHAQRFGNLAEATKTAVSDYIAAVREGTFPTTAHAGKIAPDELAAALADRP